MTDESKAPPTCPTCEGTKRVTERLVGSLASHELNYRCPTCKGTGIAPPMFADLIAAEVLRVMKKG